MAPRLRQHITIPVTVARVRARRFELRDLHGTVLEAFETKLAVYAAIVALERAGRRLALTWEGCEPP